MGRAILPAKEYAKALGCLTVAEEGVPMMPTDSTTELRRIQAKNPDAIIVGHIPAPFSVILKDAARVGLTVPFYCTFMTKKDDVVHYGKEFSIGVYGMDTTGLWYKEYEKYPAIALANKVIREKHPEIANSPWPYYDGWQKAMIMEEALKRTVGKEGVADYRP